MDPASHLLDQDRSESRVPDALVDAQKVDFDRLDFLRTDEKICRDGGNEADEFGVVLSTDTNVPVFPPARSLQSPKC
jgi:hypothetical protein